jgi:hypothetical protein
MDARTARNAFSKTLRNCGNCDFGGLGWVLKVAVERLLVSVFAPYRLVGFDCTTGRRTITPQLGRLSHRWNGAGPVSTRSTAGIGVGDDVSAVFLWAPSTLFAH